MVTTVARFVFAERDYWGGGCQEDGGKKGCGRGPPLVVFRVFLCPRGIMNEREFSRRLYSLESECQELQVDRESRGCC